MAASFIAVYRGETVGSAEIVGLTADPDIVGDLVDRILEREPEHAGDPVRGAAERGRREALELVRDELDDDHGSRSEDPPVRIRELVNHLADAGEDQQFTVEITPGGDDGRPFRAEGRAWYVAKVIDTLAGGARMTGLLDADGCPTPVTELADHRDGGADE